MNILTDERRLKDKNSGMYEAPHIPGYYELQCFHIPLDEPYLHQPMGKLPIRRHAKVILRSMDGSGEYALGIVIAVYPKFASTEYLIISEGNNHGNPRVKSTKSSTKQPAQGRYRR